MSIVLCSRLLALRVSKESALPMYFSKQGFLVFWKLYWKAACGGVRFDKIAVALHTTGFPVSL